MNILGQKISFETPANRISATLMSGPVKALVIVGGLAVAGCTVHTDPNFLNPAAGGAQAAGNSHGEACMEGGDFSVLAGIFAGSSSRYNEDCGFQTAISAIFYNENSTEEEKAVALRALANRYPGVERRLNEVAQAILEGRNPLFPALDADDTITCQVGQQTDSTAATTTFRIDRCGPTATPGS